MAQANIACAPALTFQSTTFNAVMRDGKPWVRGLQVATALGYKNPAQDFKNLYERNKEEFTDRMTTVVKLETAGGAQDTRIFSLRGAHLLAMFARTAKAAEFRRWVLDVLDREVEQPVARAHNPAIDYDRISPAQAQELKELVQAVVSAGKQRHAETWARLHAKFRVNSYLELPAAKFAEARDYLLGKLPEPQPIPRLDAQQLQQALAASNAIAAQVQAAAFAQMLGHPGHWHNERWMLAFTEGRDGQLQPYAKMLAHDAIAMPVAQIARAIASSDLQPSPEELAALLTACSNQLARHAGRQLAH